MTIGSEPANDGAPPHHDVGELFTTEPKVHTPSALETWVRRPTPAYLRALVRGGSPKSRLPNPNTPADLGKHDPEELGLIIEEGRRQLDRQTDSYKSVQDRAQILITVALVVLGFNTGVFSRLDEATGWQHHASPWVWASSSILVVTGLLMAAAVVSVRGDFMVIDTTQVTAYDHPLSKTLADDYADSVRLGAMTVADRVNAFQIATRYTVWGAALTAVAFMLTA